MNKLEIQAKLWHRGGEENYHTAKILIDNESPIDLEYSYGDKDQCLKNILTKLEIQKLIVRKKGQTPQEWAESNGVELIYLIQDVKTREEL